MSKTQEEEIPPASSSSPPPPPSTKPPTPPPPFEFKMRSERRAARVAQEKIAESAKYLASNKIMATTSPPPSPKRKYRKKKMLAPPAVATSALKPSLTVTAPKPTAVYGTSSSASAQAVQLGQKKPVASVTPQQNATAKPLIPPLRIRPQTLAGKALPKMPILVFNSLGTPRLIPIVSSSSSSSSMVSLPSNTILTLASGGGLQSSLNTATTNILKTTLLQQEQQQQRQSNSQSPDILPRPVSTENSTSSDKFKTHNNSSNHSIGLAMECEDETLSSAQWSKYKKAESAYMDVVRKLCRWKGRSDVEIVQLGPNDPIPPVPRFLNVQEASRLAPVKPVTCASMIDADAIMEMDNMPTCDAEVLTPLIQMEDEKERNDLSPDIIVIRSDQTTSLSSKPNVKTAEKETPSTSGSSLKRPREPAVAIPSEISAILKAKMKLNKSSVDHAKTVPIAPAPPSVNKESAHALHNAELSMKVCPQKLLSFELSSAKKLKLDAFMRKLIQSGKNNVDRWMLEKGLFGVNRICLFHPKVQMKLMFMSNQSKNAPPLAPIELNADGKLSTSCRGEGTYKWWCPGCGVMLPVDQGSFFAKWTRSHSSTLRVIYHWACNTDVKLVIHEMNEDRDFVAGVYAAIRTVCAKQSYRWRVGGAGHPVEIANEDIGHCKDTNDVNIYCAYDRLTRHVKLGAAPITAIRPKMASLFRVLVDKDSYVVGHRTWIANLPSHFKNNFVCGSSQIVNLNAIAYLRDYAIPAVNGRRADIKLESIQRLLEELAWREKFGRDPLDAYNSILSHIKQSFVSSVVTSKSPRAVPITAGSGLKVVNATPLAKTKLTELATPTVNYSQEELQDTSILVVPTPSVETSEPATDATSVIAEEIVAVVYSNLPSSSEAISEGGADEKTMAPLKRSSSDIDHRYNSATKAKRLKADSDSQIKVSSWMPPIGVQLESYYYATKDGNAAFTPAASSSTMPTDRSEITSDDSKATTSSHIPRPRSKTVAGKIYKFKCHACKKSVDDNLKIMRHLHGHINALKQFNLDLSDLTHCKYCFREFASPYAMQTHVEEVHVAEEPAALVCRICDKEFINVTSLCQHMKTTHVQSEMPYKCLVCKFRTSFYRDIISHFNEMHGGTDKLLCIHCLQVFAVRFSLGLQEGQTYSFYRHIYKHQSKSTNRHCPSCCLSFLSLGELQQHRISDHCSFAKQNGVKSVLASNKSKSIYIDLEISSEARESKKERKLLCIECKLSVHASKHFTDSNRCSKCSFVTCCAQAFHQHLFAVHLVQSSLKKSQLTPFPTALTCELTCVCNFSTRNGDAMAKHLSKCEYKWCYVSGDADINSKLDLPELCDEEDRDGDDKNVDAGESKPGGSATPTGLNDDQHNMMNVLGLMRVNPRRRSKSTASS